jgi:hypothetical protein
MVLVVCGYEYKICNFFQMLMVKCIWKQFGIYKLTDNSSELKNYHHIVCHIKPANRRFGWHLNIYFWKQNQKSILWTCFRLIIMIGFGHFYKRNIRFGKADVEIITSKIICVTRRKRNYHNFIIYLFCLCSTPSHVRISRRR